ncbi:hypothetical protein [Pseudomonas asplenii]|nr:hypothetical protein [Pseudomonas asplenii]UZE28460.1 hypothetical protein LOY63_24615 [Pseudomonas asplenii]
MTITATAQPVETTRLALEQLTSNLDWHQLRAPDALALGHEFGMGW